LGVSRLYVGSAQRRFFAISHLAKKVIGRISQANPNLPHVNKFFVAETLISALTAGGGGLL
jgi:hypothetical protein